MENKELLEMLLSTPSPSGYELNMQKKLIEYMKDVDEEVITSENYNVVHVLNPNAKTKILFSAHIDEIGVVINKINDNGICEVEPIGGARAYMYAGQHVYVLTKNGKVPGVFGYLPHMDKGITVADLRLDLGVSSREEALKIVNIGDPITHQMCYSYLNNNRLAAKALDDKIAVYIFLSLMKRLKGKTDLGIYVSTSVGEETTCRGVEAAVKTVKPNAVICADVTYAADLNYRENLHGEIALGKGPVLTEGSLMNKKLDQLFINAAKDLEINTQREVAPGRTYTDSDYSYYQGLSTPTYLVSIPLRYMHSSVEVCDLQDIKQIIDLMEKFVLNFNANTSFNPFDE